MTAEDGRIDDGCVDDLPHPWFARLYARCSAGMEAEGMGALRDELLGDARGDVVEVGAGNGLNFAHYPATVMSVVAVEPEPHLRGLARQAAQAAPGTVTVTGGTATSLPLPDASVDVAVLSLVLCSVADLPGALAEVARVLRPSGEVRFLEHEQAGTRGLRAVQRAVDATFWPRVAAGCHTSRRPADALRAAGFEVTVLRRLRFPDTRVPAPAAPHVLGTATRRP